MPANARHGPIRKCTWGVLSSLRDRYPFTFRTHTSIRIFSSLRNFTSRIQGNSLRRANKEFSMRQVETFFIAKDFSKTKKMVLLK